MYCLLFHFFFKQKTAYELRISDWSSDVCSSDLQTSVGRMIQTAFFAGCAGLLLFAASVLALPPRMDAPVTNAITPRPVNFDTLFQLGLLRGALLAAGLFVIYRMVRRPPAAALPLRPLLAAIFIFAG